MSALKTWIEIDQARVTSNVGIFRSLIGPRVKLWAVVKSNAYGHGFTAFSAAAEKAGVDGFCVDSVPEALKLRQDGIQKPILVLGPTLPNLLASAAKEKITLSLSTKDSIDEMVAAIPNPADRPEVHLKIDTGMHRRGFYPDDLHAIAALCIQQNIKVTGVMSHFAAAKDTTYLTYPNQQFAEFERAVTILENAGIKNLTRHISATGGTMIDSRFHLDAVRLGIGLYGIFPSRELEMQLSTKLALAPALSWYALVSETKKIKAGEFVGYDLTERLTRDITAAIVPIGYWHGLPWALSGIGSVIIRGKRCKILGRVSMDVIVVDATEANCTVGDVATLIGTEGDETITARELAAKANTTPYEIITRINPLIERTRRER